MVSPTTFPSADAAPGNHLGALSQLDPGFTRKDEWGVQNRKSGLQCYWKKGQTLSGGQEVTDKGYVHIGSASPVDLVRALDKGYSPLRQFGEFYIWNADEGWRTMVEPYRRIFQWAARDESILRVFPLKQIVEHKWHLKAPYKGEIRFPHLQEALLEAEAQGRVEANGHVTLIDRENSDTPVRLSLAGLACGQCGRHFINDVELGRHRNAGHPKESANSSLADSIAAASLRHAGPLGEVLERLSGQAPAGSGDQSALISEMVRQNAASQAQTNQLLTLLTQVLANPNAVASAIAKTTPLEPAGDEDGVQHTGAIDASAFTAGGTNG